MLFGWLLWWWVLHWGWGAARNYGLDMCHSNSPLKVVWVWVGGVGIGFPIVSPYVGLKLVLIGWLLGWWVWDWGLGLLEVTV